MSDPQSLIELPVCPINFIYFWIPKGYCLVHSSPSLNRFLVQFNQPIIRVSQNVLSIAPFGT